MKSFLEKILILICVTQLAVVNMQLQLTRLVLSLSVLAFVVANTVESLTNTVGVSERFSDLRCVLKFEYRPENKYSYLKHMNYYGRGPIHDWDNLVITYIDEEYRDFLKEGSESTNIFGDRNLLPRGIKVGDTLGKSMRELETYFEKKREGEVGDVLETFDMVVTEGRRSVFERLWKAVYAISKFFIRLIKAVFAIPKFIKTMIVFRRAVGRNGGLTYEGEVYTISLNGYVWRVLTLPTLFGNNYNLSTAPNLTERIGFCIDPKMEALGEKKFQITAWCCNSDDNGNWQPEVCFIREDVSVLHNWRHISSNGFYCF